MVHHHVPISSSTLSSKSDVFLGFLMGFDGFRTVCVSNPSKESKHTPTMQHASLQEPETQRAVATSGSLRLFDMLDENRHVYYCRSTKCIKMTRL